MRKVVIYFSQFNLLEAFKLLFIDVLRKLLDPHSVATYSQTGEDRIISHLLPKKCGYYVDVGCNHPIKYSNTFMLYKMGWNGVAIDANNGLIREFKRIRARDDTLCAVISDKEQDIMFTEFEEPLLSSVDSRHITEWTDKNRTVKGRKMMKSVTLGAALKMYNVPTRFELLTIDVEGHDFIVLKSIDLNVYRPQVIVIEMHEFDPMNPASNRIVSYLVKHSYKLVGYVICNGYFLDCSE